jgi:nitrogen-specific signal transduction histidine kinase
VAQLVDRHHGQVSVWSTQREGRSGTAFSVFLPFELSGAKSSDNAAVQSSATLARAVD